MIYRREKLAATFIGTYNHTVDDKGRLIIPTKFRDGFGKGFYITNGIDKCLYGYDEESWNAFAEKISKQSITKIKIRKFATFILGGASNIEFDKLGRIVVPQKLRNYAGIDKEVVLVGAGNRIEIWDKDRYEENFATTDIAEIAEELDLEGVDLGI